MKRSLLALIILSALTASAAVAQVQSPGVKIVSLPGHVTQGALEHLNATVPRSTTCSLTVIYASGKMQSLGHKPTRGRRAAWTWRVPVTAGVGTAKARVSCKGLLSRTGTFAVARRLTPATVTVIKTGFTQTPDGFDAGTEISYGIELVNRSPDEDAMNVEVDVNLLDAAGNAIASDSNFVTGIPAGATFYVGREASTDGPTAVARISAVAKVSYGMPKALISPVVSNVRFSADAADGSVVVDGDVTNEATKNLSSLAEISAVFFDGAGNIIGGGFDFPSFGLPPGAQTAFEIDTGPGGPQASTVAQVKISVDSDYGND